MSCRISKKSPVVGEQSFLCIIVGTLGLSCVRRVYSHVNTGYRYLPTLQTVTRQEIGEKMNNIYSTLNPTAAGSGLSTQKARC